MSRAIYITGTDTGVGKTAVSVALVHALRNAGMVVAAMKPVASGAMLSDGEWRNEDGLALLESTGLPLPYEDVNPVVLEQPTAPEIAAAMQGARVEIEWIDTAHARLRTRCDLLVVEGVGGWMAPLSATLMQADLCTRWQLPVLLVVGVRLGCINHALLTLRCIEADGLRCVGWIANAVDPSLLFPEQTLALLDRHLPVPRLGTLPFDPAEAPARRARRILHQHILDEL